MSRISIMPAGWEVDFEGHLMIKEPSPDMCKCGNCNNTFKVDDCETEYDHHDGWEMPAYTEILCPVCEDGGCIDDFFFSKEL